MTGLSQRVPAAFVLVAAAVLAQRRSRRRADLKAKFESASPEIAARVDGVVGYSIVDLTTGERIAPPRERHVSDRVGDQAGDRLRAVQAGGREERSA